MKSILLLCIALALGAMAIGGCRAATTPGPTSAPSPLASADTASTLVRTELYFGLGRRDGPDVSEQEWRQFVDQQITPRFPDGLTILEGQGQWRAADGVVRREPSRVMILLHAPGDEADRRVEQIRSLYRQQFGQESVLRTDAVQRVSF